MPMVLDIIPAEGWIPRSASIVMIAGTPIYDTAQLRVSKVDCAAWSRAVATRTGPIPTPSVASKQRPFRFGKGEAG